MKLCSALFLLLLLTACAARAGITVNTPVFGTRVSSGTSPLTVSGSVTAASGDLIVAVLAVYNSSASGPCPTIATPSGFTVQGTPACTNSRNEIVVYTRTASGTSADNFSTSLTWSGGTQYAEVAEADILGANTAAPVDKISSYVGGSGSTSQIAPAPPNTTVNGDLLLSAWMSGYQAATGVSCTAPCTGTYTFAREAATDTPPNNTLAYAIQATAGTVNPASATYGTAPTQYQAVTVAIAPTALPGGGTVYPLATQYAGGPYTGGAAQPTPAPPAQATPPPYDQDSWWLQGGVNDNNAISLANLQKYGPEWCTGSGTSTGAGAPTQHNCYQSGEYFSGNLANPAYSFNLNCTGSSTLGGACQLPWAVNLTDNGSGVCPSAAKSSTPFFAQNPVPYDHTSADTTKNWWIYPSSKTLGVDANIGAGYGYSGNAEYNLFPNLLSTTYQSYAASIMRGCNDSRGLSLDQNSFIFEDNTFVGGASNGWNVWGGPAFYSADGGYTQHRNWGSRTDGTPFGYMGCNGGLPGVFTSGTSGTPCTTSTQLQTTEGVNGNYGNDTTNTDNAYVSFFGAFNHLNGTAQKFNYNGFFNTDLTVISSSHVIGATIEEYLIGFCAAYTATTNGCSQHVTHGAQYIIDNCAALGNHTSGKSIFPLNDAPSLVPSTAGAQWNQRLIWGVTYICENDTQPHLVVNWNNLEGGQTRGTQQNDVWPGGFIRPYSRVGETFLQDVAPVGTPCARNSLNSYSGTNTACTSGGAADTVMTHSASGGACATNSANCLDAVEFTHAYYQTAQNLQSWPGAFGYTSGNTVSDFGNFAVIYNSTGSAVTITSTLLAAILVNDASYGHVLAFCTPSSYFNTTGSGNIYTVNSTAGNTVCSGSSGEDVINGGTIDASTTLTSILNEQLENNDVLILVP